MGFQEAARPELAPSCSDPTRPTNLQSCRLLQQGPRAATGRRFRSRRPWRRAGGGLVASGFTGLVIHQPRPAVYSYETRKRPIPQRRLPRFLGRRKFGLGLAYPKEANSQQLMHRAVAGLAEKECSRQEKLTKTGTRGGRGPERFEPFF